MKAFKIVISNQKIRMAKRVRTSRCQNEKFNDHIRPDKIDSIVQAKIPNEELVQFSHETYDSWTMC